MYTSADFSFKSILTSTLERHQTIQTFNFGQWYIYQLLCYSYKIFSIWLWWKWREKIAKFDQNKLLISMNSLSIRIPTGAEGVRKYMKVCFWSILFLLLVEYQKKNVILLSWSKFGYSKKYLICTIYFWIFYAEQLFHQIIAENQFFLKPPKILYRLWDNDESNLKLDTDQLRRIAYHDMNQTPF